MNVLVLVLVLVNVHVLVNGVNIMVDHEKLDVYKVSIESMVIHSIVLTHHSFTSTFTFTSTKKSRTNTDRLKGDGFNLAGD